ncbi:MAG: hypothetical protein JF601_08275 [Acidobacteria bacterium]|nr:hypothetical protein [Acidobacteriota bacterium]
MAFFRFSRDKRGYEHFYLVEPVTNRKGKSRPRVLYWYRTPPNVKVGRPPFDDEMRRAIEAQYPDVTFDWTKIVEAPIPSADAEQWRERRRAERAERVARKSNGAVDADQEREPPEEPDPAASIDEEPIEPELPSSLAIDVESGGESVDGARHVPGTWQAPLADAADAAPPDAAATGAVADDANAQETGEGGQGARKRRRRRRGRGQSGSYASATPPVAAGESPIDTSGSAFDDHTSDDHASDDAASDDHGSDDDTSDDPIDEPSGE